MVATTTNIAAPPSLRAELKARTRDLHDRLDGAMGSAAIGDDARYGAFLTVQYRARRAIESWAQGNLAPDIQPPETAPLIARDLATLGLPTPAPVSFALPEGADPLGLAWALGGSSLGNRAMLTRRHRAGHTMGESFLADPASADYFRRLRPELERATTPEQADRAVLAAEAVFHAFLSALAATDGLSEDEKAAA